MEKITIDDLLFDSDNYKPLGTQRAIRNYPSEFDFSTIDLNKLFFSDDNQQTLIHRTYKLNQESGGRTPLEKFVVDVPQYMKKFITDEKDLNKYRNGLTNYSDWVRILQFVNQRFMKRIENLISHNRYNPFRHNVLVNGEFKKSSDLLADDIRNLNVNSAEEIFVYNDTLRHSNRIPFYQHTMHRRHYDRSNEGLQAESAERASLETPIYKYNMKEIHNTIDDWKKSEWYGM